MCRGELALNVFWQCSKCEIEIFCSVARGGGTLVGSRVERRAAAAKLGAGQEWETVNCFPFFKTGNL